MKPHRITMTHHLVLGYGLHKHLDVYVRRGEGRVQVGRAARD